MYDVLCTNKGLHALGRLLVMFFFLFGFELQLAEFIGQVDPERTEWQLPERIHGEVVAGKLGLLVDVFIERIGCGESEAEFLVKELFPDCQAI